MGESQNNLGETRPKEYVTRTPLILNSEKCKLVHSDRQQISSRLGPGLEGVGEGTFGDKGVILYLDHGGDYRSMRQNAEISSLF